jgi:hypothetical protein
VARVLKKPWHEEFFSCVSPHTDIPDNFVTWSALSFIGAALKNNVFFEIGTYTLYPNMFVVLVSPPGIGKGTAMDIVESMNNENKLNKIVNTLNDRITAEKIIEQIADGWAQPPRIVGMQMVVPPTDHNCLIFSTELRTLLGSSDWMLEFLEEAWSKKTFDYQTKNKGSVFIDNMCCSLLAASVPDFLRNVNREAHMVITGGFSSRCLFIYSENTSKDLPFPEPLKKNKVSKAKWDDLLTDVRAISSLRGEFTIDPPARILFENFLKKNRTSQNGYESEAVINFKARIKAHILKLGMSFSASRGDSLCINLLDMHNAITECEKVAVSLAKLFRGAGDSVDALAIARVQNFMEAKGGVTKKEILSALYMHIGSMENVDRILWTLEISGWCVKSTQGKFDYYMMAPTVKTGGKNP